MQLTIIRNPKVSHLNDIEDWLLNEDKSTTKGFYCNWNVIHASFLKGQLFCLKDGEDVVGFLTFRLNNFVVTIDTMEIHPKYRGKGLGRKLFTDCADIFRSSGCLVVDLHSISDESPAFWMSLGFAKYPNRDYNGDEDRMYLLLVTSAVPISSNANSTVLAFWQNEPYLAKGSQPFLTWDLGKEDTILPFPIIEPCSAEWLIEIRRGPDVLFSDKIKRLANCSYYHDGYLIIHTPVKMQ